MQVLLFGNQRVAHLPFTLPNGMKVLRFDRPSRTWPSGKVVLNDGHTNYIAAPPAVGLEVKTDAQV